MATAFAAYLIEPGHYRVLVRALDSAGLDGQGALLRAYWADGADSADGTLLGSVWAGRQCALGLTPPADAAGGDLWFDPVEVSVMVLVPWPAEQYAAWPMHVRQRMTRYVSWLSIDRTSAWQVRGWADATGGTGVPAELGNTGPALGLSGQTADSYARYFGKTFATYFAWRAVAAMGSLGERLWPDNTPELTGYGNEGEVTVHRRDQALSPEDDDEADDDDGIFGDWPPLPGVAFRTQISNQLGLFNDRSRWGRGVI